MDIKAELRLIREQCPITWERIKNKGCPDQYDNNLKCYYITKNRCYVGDSCDKCWDKAIEEENR